MLTKSAVFSSLSFSAVVKSIVVLLPFLPPLTATDLAATLVGAEAEADCGGKGGGGWVMRNGAGGGARAGRPRQPAAVCGGRRAARSRRGAGKRATQQQQQVATQLQASRVALHAP